MRAALLALLLALSVGHAQAAVARHPDLSGFWDLDAATPADAGLMAKLPKGAVFLKDTGAVEFPRGEFGGLKLKPGAAAAAKAWDPKEDLGVAKACSPPSIVYAMQGPFPMQIDQGTELIVFRLEYYDLIRIIYMDGRGHPPADAPHSKMGHSIGRWDGNELVVDTTHLEAATITNNGLSHGEGAHVVERFKLSPDGKSLLSTQLFDDAETLDSVGARFIAWRKKPGEYIYPYDCDPTFGLNYEPGAKP